MNRLITIDFIVCSCQTTYYPEVPPLDEQMSIEEAQLVFDDFELSKHGSIFFGTHFLQGSKTGQIMYPQLPSLFNLSSEEAQLALKRVTRQATTANIFAGLGGACIGFPIGSYIVSGEFNEADYILLITGGVLVVSSIITSIVSDRTFEEAIQMYNEYLEIQLSLK